MDLGTKIKPGVPAVSPAETKEKTTYPDFTLRDEIAKKQLADNDCELGEEYTATVRLRVSALRQDEYGQSVSYEVLSMDDFTDADGEDGEDDGEEKTLGYKRPGKSEGPDTSAADNLED